MIIVDNVFVPRSMLTVRFTCPYKQCGSMCCVSGERGSPVLEDEIQRIEQYLHKISPGLDPECAARISNSGFYEADDGSLNLQCLDVDKRCVFSRLEKNGVSCYLETVSQENEMETLRPVSCRLFPIRIRRHNGLEILDYEIWEECQKAWNIGSYLLDFCRNGLTDNFGHEWMVKLDKARQYAIDSLNAK
ncbi:DUF3109 family protein [bacterium]|nr:DUF3109 family protein [bacterium]